MSRRGQVRFRPSQAITVAALIAFIGALPLAAVRWFLTPVLLIPLLVGIWTLRAGTDAGRDGVQIRALLWSRRIPWTAIAALAADPNGRVVARLTDGRTMALPAVRGTDLPRLVAASGRPLVEAESAAGENPAAGGDPAGAESASAESASGTAAERRPADQ